MALDGQGLTSPAQPAGLAYVGDHEPGLQRVSSATGFDYRDAAGARVDDPETLERIRGLAIPPAWTDVWICPDPNGHIQATGRDKRGRKQYRYHPRWREHRDSAKYHRMAAFGRALPRLRAQVDRHLRLRGMPREKVLAAVVRLLELTLIRVGNDEYARKNRSFGLTTLRKRHVDVHGSGVAFEFRGKSGKHHRTRLHDARLARVIRSCEELPGQRLFQYLGEDGQTHVVSSHDVNAYIHAAVGEDFTAKDFRTWAGSLLAAQLLAACERAQNQTQHRCLVADCVKQVASRLGNTPAVCRSSYIHPEVIAAYADDRLEDGFRRCLDHPETCEKAMLRFLGRLQARAAATKRRPKSAA
ncbi:MAG: DNA topoisomerase IB [Phenylobacterium sp.]